jgi:hypothetical protein
LVPGFSYEFFSQNLEQMMMGLNPKPYPITETNQKSEPANTGSNIPIWVLGPILMQT